MGGKKQAVCLLATIVVAAVCGISSAVTHTVGDTTGWRIPSSPSFYSTWAAAQTFTVGDVLVFNFPAGAHTVAQVSRRNFDACNTGTTIGAVQNTSPANITLTTAGTHYFICTIPTHCSSNQKLSVVVTGQSAAAPTPSGGATTPAASPTGSVTVPGGAEGPSATSAPPPSFATSTSVGVLSLVSVVAAAFMF